MDSLEPIVKIEIGGQNYEMKPTFKAISDIERDLGKALFAYLDQNVGNENVTFYDLITIIRHGVKAGSGEDLDVEEVGNSVVGEYIYFFSKAVEFLSISFRGKPEESKKKIAAVH